MKPDIICEDDGNQNRRGWRCVSHGCVNRIYWMSATTVSHDKVLESHTVWDKEPLGCKVSFQIPPWLKWRNCAVALTGPRCRRGKCVFPFIRENTHSAIHFVLRCERLAARCITETQQRATSSNCRRINGEIIDDGPQLDFTAVLKPDSFALVVLGLQKVSCKCKIV